MQRYNIVPAALVAMSILAGAPEALAYEDIDRNRIHDAIDQHCLENGDLVAKIARCLDFYRDNLALHVAVRKDEQQEQEFDVCRKAVIAREPDRAKRHAPIERCEIETKTASASRFLQDPRTPFDKMADAGSAGCWELYVSLADMTEELQKFTRRDSFGLAAMAQKGCSFVASLVEYRTGKPAPWYESECAYGPDTAAFRRCMTLLEVDANRLVEERRICRDRRAEHAEYRQPAPPPYTNPYRSMWLEAANYEASKKLLLVKDLMSNRWNCDIIEALAKEMLPAEKPVAKVSPPAITTPLPANPAMDGMAFKAAHGTAEDAFQYAMQLSTNNRGFINPSTGRLLPSVLTDDLERAAFYLARAAQMGHAQAERYLPTLAQYTSAVDEAREFLSSDAETKTYAAFQARASSGSSGNTVTSMDFVRAFNTYMLSDLCTRGKLSWSAAEQGNSAGLIMLQIPGAVATDSRSCAVTAGGVRWRISARSATDLQCTEADDLKAVCSATVYLDCEMDYVATDATINPDERALRDRLTCGVLRALPRRTTAALTRPGEDWQIVTLLNED